MERSYSNSGSSDYGGAKEKRPPLKRGQLKRQIVRTISNLVLPRNDDMDAEKRAAGRISFSTYN
ncbi:hypothetical protein CFC21_007720 [Triticum aestivum]|uniref:Uncharacterized protein n=2 Tax=Triticum aestivum TaxID=4565 RepID=A0A3B5Z0D9_WHEAT|nr:hypothetical protein CFC21_007720 [Triticum aestivum]